MIRNRFFFSLVSAAISAFFLIAAGCSNPSASSELHGNGDAAGWKHREVASDDDSGLDSSIVVDGSDLPYILYQRQVGYDYYARYASSDGSGWKDERVDAAGGETEIARQSLVLDNGGDLHAAIYHLANDDLGHAERSGSSWSLSKPPEGSYSNTGFGASVAVDSDGHPHISHLRVRSSGSWKLLYTYRDDSGWTTLVADDPDITTTLNIRGFTAIALDVDGRPHIAYKGTYNSGTLRYAHYNGSSWQREMAAEVKDVDFAPTGIALDSSGTPYIVATRKDFSDYSALLAYRTGTDAWQTEEIAPVHSENAAMVIDESDRVHVSYVRESHLEYAWRVTTGSWNAEVVDETRSVDGFTSIALDSGGHPHISYYDDQYDDLWYAYWQ
jgi:hypothetical protein